MINSLDLAAVSHFGVDKKSSMEARRRAVLHFSKALSRGAWRKIWGRLLGQDTRLEHLGQRFIVAGKRTAARSGIVDVPLNRIVGSEGRTGDFDDQFNPLKIHLQERWTNIAAARSRGVVLPPVELIQIGNNYYVRDGHHRISVAKARGQATIEAELV